MVGQIVAVLIVLLFIAALYMTSKNWGIPQVVLLFAIFAATATFVVFAAMTLKTNEAYRKKYNQLTQQIESTNDSIALLEVGNPLDPESTPDTIPRLEKRLALQLVGRGRVWRGVTPSGAAGGSVTVDMTGANGDDCYGTEADEDELLEPEPVAEEPVEEPEEPAEEPADAAAAAIGGDIAGAEEDGAEPPAGLPGEEIPDAGTPDAAAPDAATPDADAADDDGFFGGAAGAGDGGRDAGGGGDSSPHGIEAGMVVYVFEEVPAGQLLPAQQKSLYGESDLPKKDTRGLCRVPAHYLGSFLVKGAQGNSLAMTPVLALDQDQTKRVSTPQGTWTIFEVMPVDGHDLAETLPKEDLPGLFPNSPYSQDIVAEYSRDMQPANADDAPERTMVKVKILKEHPVNVDTANAAKAMEGSFDPEGRAVLSYLLQGAPTTLSEGAELFVSGETAEKWIGEGICERSEGDAIYTRPLRNYDIIFHQSFDKATRVTAEMGVFTKDNATITTAANKARAQIEFRKGELTKIKQDQGYIDGELELLGRYQAKVQGLFNAQRKSLSQFYRANSRNADSLRGPVQVSTNR